VNDPTSLLDALADEQLALTGLVDPERVLEGVRALGLATPGPEAVQRWWARYGAREPSWAWEGIEPKDRSATRREVA
jgi:hypothetical protein